MLWGLRGSHTSMKWARRGLVLIFAWGLVMIATLQFHHAMNDNSLSSGGNGENEPSSGLQYRLRSSDHQDDGPPRTFVGEGGGGAGGGGGGSSRYLMQRYSANSTTSIDNLKNSRDYDGKIADGPKTTATLSGSTESVKRTGEALEPLIDKRASRTEEELVREIESRMPSLPLADWLKWGSQLGNNSKKKANDKNNISGNKTGRNSKTTKNACLPRFPSIFELEFSNIYWQTLRTSNGTFQLLGAYYDVRKLSKMGPAIRIVGMIDRIDPRVKTYCQMWFDGDREPGIVETLEYKYVWYAKWGNYKQGIYQPYVIACKIPQSHRKRGPPASISIVERPCDTSTNNLRVIYNKPDVKRGFAVCVKGLDFLHDDLSVRLVEWIELIGLLGADKIFFYQLQVHPNVSKVLDHYTKLGKVEVTPITLPGGQPNIPAFQHMYLIKKTGNKRLDEVIPYNDCMYKHMYEYEYIALLDVDEVIMPLKDSTWPELMKRILPKALALRNETRASYDVRNVYFLDDFLHSHASFQQIPK